MKKGSKRWQLFLIVLLISLSALFYFLHYLIFHDPHHIFIYMVGDVAFVPIEVLLVTLIIHRLLEAHEKRSLLKKLNMVIGIFFSEIGTELLKELSGFCANHDGYCGHLKIDTQWKKKNFTEARSTTLSFPYEINAFLSNTKDIEKKLSSKRSFFIDLLGNANLLEHEKFTDLLWALLHLTEELSVRPTLDDLPQKDKDHISNDMKRAYALLIVQWLNYMEHLKQDYPYLFSLAVRTNPFNPEASPIINKT